ncbi:hypothetical protein CPB86DRAFT_788542 [Serendipita vermifera]|nr:hypothetical protein CPB86DRAFT_788542 [Serendipita vermifera]
MSIHIKFSNNSLRNTTASCDSLGIHYEISTTQDRVIHVHKWDSKNDQYVPVGELKFYVFKQDEIRMPGETEWRPMIDIFKKASSFWIISRIFSGNDGKEYRWKATWGNNFMHNVNDVTEQRLIQYHRDKKGHVSWLEILDPSVLSSLDSILREYLAFLITETKRRTEKKRRVAIAVAVGAAA